MSNNKKAKGMMEYLLAKVDKLEAELIETYTIKPLMWNYSQDQGGYTASTRSQNYLVRSYKGNWWWRSEMARISCSSLEDGQHQCWKHHCEQIQKELDANIMKELTNEHPANSKTPQDVGSNRQQ